MKARVLLVLCCLIACPALSSSRKCGVYGRNAFDFHWPKYTSTAILSQALNTAWDTVANDENRVALGDIGDYPDQQECSNSDYCATFWLKSNEISLDDFDIDGYEASMNIYTIYGDCLDSLTTEFGFDKPTDMTDDAWCKELQKNLCKEVAADGEECKFTCGAKPLDLPINVLRASFKFLDYETDEDPFKRREKRDAEIYPADLSVGHYEFLFGFCDSFVDGIVGARLVSSEQDDEGLYVIHMEFYFAKGIDVDREELAKCFNIVFMFDGYGAAFTLDSGNAVGIAAATLVAVLASWFA